MCSAFAACKKKPVDTESEDDRKVAITSKQTIVADFSDDSVISASGLNKVSGGKRSENGGAVTLSGSEQTVSIPFTKTDLSNDMEFSIWIYSSSDTDIKVKLYAISDDEATATTEYYASPKIAIKSGWNEYRLPFSEFTPGTSAPLGWGTVTQLDFTFDKAKDTAGVTVTFDTVCVCSQKIGTMQGFEFSAISDAVCFYEDCGLYFYNQLRYSMNENDESVAVKSDNDTMFVPVSVLAQHRGATDITVSEDKTTVSFKYGGKDYSFKVGDSVQYTGIDTGNRPGRALSSKLISSGDYVLVPMEYCADIFGYKLFYNEMGIAVFSDTLYSYDPNKTSDYNTLYDLTEAICYKNYTGAEMLRNMDALYPNDEHTRLLANQDDFDRLKKLIETDSTYAAWFKRFSSQYDKDSSTYKSAGSSKFELTDGYRLLVISREVMNRVIPLAVMYKLTDDVDYATAVAKDLTALTKFNDPMTGTKSWHPEHFLDTGEIMWAFALGYDWCYDTFTDEQRESYEEAAWELGFGAAFGFGDLYDWWADDQNLKDYEEKQSIDLGKEYKYTGYSGKTVWPYPNGTKSVKWSNNWSTVCNGGMTALALAFANVESDDPTVDFRSYSETLLDCVTYCIPACLKISYAPDGGYPEGPGYWSYGTTYAAVLFCNLQSATGSSYGFFNCAGFGESFYFTCGTAGEGGTWNYHDAGSGGNDTSIFSMYAKISGDSNIGAYRYDRLLNGSASVSYWDMVFYDPANYGDSIDMPLDSYYKEIRTVTFRSSWDDENALFCGLHGGDNNASHGQLDIGNFILEYGSNRFFIDLGSDEYNLKYDGSADVKYFSYPWRHWYYRMRAEGHNTLVVNPSAVDITNTDKSANQEGRQYDQLYAVTSDVTSYVSGDTMAYAVVDMGVAYIDANSGQRGMWVTNDRSTVIIQDEIKFKTESTVYWFGHMASGAVCTISDDKKQATITLNGMTIVCTIVTEDPSLNTQFSVMATDYLPETGLKNQTGEYDRSGYYKLVATTTGVKDYKMAVVCNLITDGGCTYEWTDIADWFVD